MSAASDPGARLLAVSDLHVTHKGNQEIVDGLAPTSDGDWLIVAGDVGERIDQVLETLHRLTQRFAEVIWVPGNHELWTRDSVGEPYRGVARYERLVAGCRELGVLTPEDPYPTWTGEGGPAVVAPLFLLYDYTFFPPGVHSVEQALEVAHAAGVVCTDEFMLHPDPYPTRQDWCAARVAYSRGRLDEIDEGLPTVLVNHWPLTPLPTTILRHPEFSIWCGTTASADWHVRYRAAAVVYGHLHIPRVIVEDDVPFIESSLGYPREWKMFQERFGIDVHHPRYVVLPKIGMNITPALLARAALPVLRQIQADGVDFDLIDAHYFYPDGVAAVMLAKSATTASARRPDSRIGVCNPVSATAPMMAAST